MKEQDQTVWMNGEGAWGGRSGPDSNYTKVVEEWRKKFLTWDQEAICRKLHINTYDENEILLRYFGVLHRIDRKTGEITCPEKPEYRPGFDESMAFYNYFYYSREGAVNSGEWVNFRDVKSAGVFDLAFRNQVLIPFAESFSSHLKEFREAGEKQGFLPIPYGDAGFQVQAFPGVPMRVVFWDGDEEFPARITILYDKNVTDFIHPENVVMLGSDCMRTFQRYLTDKR